MASQLARILEVKRTEIASMRGQKLPTPPELRRCDLKRLPPQPMRVLAEIKFRSPSAGLLSSDMSVAERAASYERAGAFVVSVLCDAQFFGGSYEHVAIAKQACSLPILCKEFILDEVQLDWARAYGADLVLIIARCMSRDELARLHRSAIERELVPLVEVATLDEAQWVNELGCPTIGVNARDLDTLAIDTDNASRILDSLPKSRVRIHLSGVKTPSETARLSSLGLDAVLIGEALMRQSDPEPLLRSIVQMADASR
jgi:indole-3-glycerol phosphate synthase